MSQKDLKVPTEATLKKYGLSILDWNEIACKQNFVCFVCEKLTTTGRLCVDHEHAKGWKKMPPEQRKLYVRGLLCWVCNHYYLGKGINIKKSINVTKYLEQYESKKVKDGNNT
jgi:hypothetical protein